MRYFNKDVGAVVFDMDGTFFDTERLFSHLFHKGSAPT